jgi:hypothetical protein
LRQFVVAHAERQPHSFLEVLREELERFSQGFGQFDDITALAVRATPVGQERIAPAADGLLAGAPKEA